MGIMSALLPTVPMMPVERSCWNEPTTVPVFANLNELARLGITVTISDLAIGKLTSPISRNGWPNAYTRLPSTNVTVPVAATLKSPLMRTAPTASPPWNSLGAAERGRAPLEVVLPLGTATKPIASRYFENRASVSGAKLDIDRGTAIGLTPV